MNSNTPSEGEKGYVKIPYRGVFEIEVKEEGPLMLVELVSLDETVRIDSAQVWKTEKPPEA